MVIFGYEASLKLNILLKWVVSVSLDVFNVASKTLLNTHVAHIAFLLVCTYHPALDLKQQHGKVEALEASKHLKLFLWARLHPQHRKETTKILR